MSHVEYMTVKPCAVCGHRMQRQWRELGTETVGQFAKRQVCSDVCKIVLAKKRDVESVPPIMCLTCEGEIERRPDRARLTELESPSNYRKRRHCCSTCRKIYGRNYPATRKCTKWFKVDEMKSEQETLPLAQRNHLRAV